jgi:hypothetical protein
MGVGGSVGPVVRRRRKGTPSRIKPLTGRLCLGRGDDSPFGVVEPHLRHGLVAHHGGRVDACGQRQLRQRGLGGDGPAFVAKRLQPAEGGDRQSRQIVQPRVLTSIRRQHGQRDVLAAGKILKGGKAVGPVGLAADQADEDRFGPGKGALGISVDRDGVFQRDDVGKTQAGQSGPVFAVRGAIAEPAPLPSRREGTKVAVGKG